MDLQNIIVWLGLIAIVVIIWDGLRRMKASKGAPPEKQEPYIDPEEAARKAQIARELPNGGARVREMTDTEKEEISHRLNLRERVPMLMERVDVQPPEEDEPETNTEAVQSELDFSSAMSEPYDEPMDSSEDDDQPIATEASLNIEDVNIDDDLDISQDVDEKDSGVTDMGLETEAPADDIEPAEINKPEPVRQKVSSKESEPVADPGPVEDLVIVHVMAHKDEELSGSSVLDLLITAGLRHGPMDIFHYRNPKGITEFSLANCVQPGTFDPDAMNQVNTPGVTLFMQLPTAADAMEAFDHMYEMARFLAKHLDAEILDEDHSTVTPQRIEYYREKIRSFKRSKLIPS